MKNIYFTLVIALLLAACGGKGEKGEDENSAEEKKGLDGTWVIKRATGSYADMQIGVTYSFDGDKLVFGAPGFENPGKTEITDKTFTFTANGTDLKFTYEYEFNGDTLVVKMQNSDQTFYLVKK